MAQQLLIDYVKVSRSIQHKLGHIRDVIPGQYLGLVLKTQRNKTKWYQYNNKKTPSYQQETQKMLKQNNVKIYKR